MSGSDRAILGRSLSAAGALALLGLLSACSDPATKSSLAEAKYYASHARGNYKPPGPPEDPWGPYIREASAKYDVPEVWIRSLMRQESGGRLYVNGGLVTSSAGAMGLMQVMPATYDGLRNRYNLGEDPYDPHDNIMAGVAYMREMYDIYGTPGFLAAYNAGPARLDDYLNNVRGLPNETRKYVASIGPNIQGIYPNNRSAADELALYDVPINIPVGRRYGITSVFASNSGGGRAPKRAPVEVAAMPEPPRYGGAKVQTFAMAAPVVTPPPPPGPTQVTAVSKSGGFHIISTANAADAAPARRSAAPSGGGQWAIQVGAYGNAAQAHGALASAQQHAHTELGVARPTVANVKQGKTVLWRARMTGLSRESAASACEKIQRGRTSCIVLSPEAQS
ncbi:MAG: lytic transglycosylase domain-containing protein [Acetobacteraceae bacterium]|nr:lytic transglycosylase domain-containing protein [Pseudomonadota bacterium]